MKLQSHTKLKPQLQLFILILMTLCISTLAIPTYASNRIALVIGNSNYADMPLKNPRNDAAAMQQVLQQAGFEVVAALDGDLQTMQNAMLDFVSQLNASSTALVFYAGHGMQANGRNYLLPVDAEIKSERSLRFQALELTDLLEELDTSNARIKMVILDACRNNPFERSMRGRGRGLAAVDAARGTLIAYATSPGATASDGEGDNGLYTQSLLENILKPGLKVEEVFKRVRIAVADASQGAQVPWESSSLTGDFVFIDNENEASPQAPRQSENASSTINQQIRAVDHEALYWDSVKNSDNAALLQSYLDKYPDGHFTELARLKLLSPQAGNQPKLATNEPLIGKRPLTLSGPDLLKNKCSDLSGRWQNTPAAKRTCAPKELRFSRSDAQSYEVRGTGCGTLLTANGYHRDKSSLIVSWKMATCTGTTTYQLNADCTQAQGEVDVDRHLLCHVKDSRETLQKLGQ